MKQMFLVDCGTYPFKILVYYGPINQTLIGELKKYGIPDQEIKEGMDPDSIAFAIMFSCGRSLLWKLTKPKNIRDLAILSHEIFHSVGLVMNRVGIPYQNGEANEAYAYLIEHLTYQIYKELNIKITVS